VTGGSGGPDGSSNFALVLEGSCELGEGEDLNYAGRKDGREHTETSPEVDAAELPDPGALNRAASFISMLTLEWCGLSCTYKWVTIAFSFGGSTGVLNLVAGMLAAELVALQSSMWTNTAKVT
jgi:hypothetical protein